MNKIEQLNHLLLGMEIVDLSHTLEENMPVWPTHSKFMHHVWSSLALGDPASNYLILMNEHNGTHMDMPAHVILDKTETIFNAETMPTDHFMGPYKKIDCSNFEKNQLLEEQDIIAWEEENVVLMEGDIILIDFGWAKYWQLKPNDKAYLDNWPGIGVTAATYFARKKVKLVGVDTMAADIYGAKGSPAHHILLEQNICILENLNHLNQIKREGFFIAQPLKIKDGSGSPIRPFAFYEK
jgi:kynurenine formamidase